MLKDSYYRKLFIFFAFLTIFIIACGWYFSITVAEKTAAALKAGLINRTKLLASLVDCEEVKKLKGSPEDSNSEIYHKYKRKFHGACDSQSDIRYIYMMGYRADSIFFYVDSEPALRADPQKPLATPGELYKDAPEGLQEVFLKGKREYTVGPYTDKWGTFFSVMLPVFDLDGKTVVCVVGMDMDADEWHHEIFKSRTLVWCLALSLLLVVLLVLVNLKNQMNRNASMQSKLYYQQVALALAQCDNSDYKSTIERITKTVAEALRVVSVGVWRFTEDFGAIVCETAYDLEKNLYESGALLSAHAYPNYFKTLNSDRNIVVNDARTDPRTRELLDDYLLPRRVTSMLDTMIWLHGRPAGVLCIEHKGSVRSWNEEEIDFALTISDLLSLAFEAYERVRAESEEQEIRLYLEKIINSVGDPIFVKDANHRFVLVNESFCRLVNKEYYEIIGKSDRDFFPFEQVMVFEKIDNLVIETGEANINEELITDASGAVRTILTKKTLYHDNKGRPYIVGVIRDVTERKKMDEERAKMSKLESIGILAGGIAHDFNNILMGILGNITLARNRCVNDNGVREVLTRAEAVVHKARSLTEQLITFSKGGLPIKKRCTIVELVKNTVQFTLSGSKMKARFDIEPDTSPVEIDEGQFAQVIANIVINARQACEDGGELLVSVKNCEMVSQNEFPHRAGRYVKLVIKDDGPGIEPENIGRIFDPYFTTKPSGSGLGLFTSYSIVSKHNGYIRAVSGKDGGAAFEIYLPAAGYEEASDAGSKSFAPSVASRPAGGCYDILIMDDEPDALAPICDMLAEQGNAVFLAENGEEALKAYENKLNSGARFDAVVADLVVKKGMGGAEFVKKLLALDPTACVLVSSGYASDKIMLEYENYGFKGAIAKPYKVDELFEAIARAVSAPRA